MSAVLAGVFHLGRDAELRYLPSGESVCNLSLAYKYGRKEGPNGKPSQWVDAGFWGKRAEYLQPHLRKGTAFFVVLEDVHIETFTRADNTTGTKLVGRVQSIDFAGGGRADSDQAPAAPTQQRAQAPASRPAPSAARAPAHTAPGGQSGFPDEDDIPF